MDAEARCQVPMVRDLNAIGTLALRGMILGGAYQRPVDSSSTDPTILVSPKLDLVFTR